MDVLSLAMSKKFTEQKTQILENTISSGMNEAWATAKTSPGMHTSAYFRGMKIESIYGVSQDGSEILADIEVRYGPDSYISTNSYTAYSQDFGATWDIFREGIGRALAHTKPFATKSDSILFDNNRKVIFFKDIRDKKKRVTPSQFYNDAMNDFIKDCSFEPHDDIYFGDIVEFHGTLFRFSFSSSDTSLSNTEPSNQYLYSEDQGLHWKTGTLPVSYCVDSPIIIEDKLFLPPASFVRGVEFFSFSQEEKNAKYRTNKFVYLNGADMTWQTVILPESLNYRSFTYENGVYVFGAYTNEDLEPTEDGLYRHILISSKDLITWNIFKICPTAPYLGYPNQSRGSTLVFRFVGDQCWLISPGNYSGEKPRDYNHPIYISWDNLATIESEPLCEADTNEASQFRRFVEYKSILFGQGDSCTVWSTYFPLEGSPYIEQTDRPGTCYGSTTFPSLNLVPKSKKIYYYRGDAIKLKGLAQNEQYKSSKVKIDKIWKANDREIYILSKLSSTSGYNMSEPKLFCNYIYKLSISTGSSRTLICEELPTEHFLSTTHMLGDIIIREMIDAPRWLNKTWRSSLSDEILLSLDKGTTWKICKLPEVKSWNLVSDKSLCRLMFTTQYTSSSSEHGTIINTPLIKSAALPTVPLQKQEREFVSGFYAGNGDAARTIRLGFTPSKVLVCEYGQNSSPVFSKISEQQFDVSSHNKLGVTYEYMAYK